MNDFSLSNSIYFGLLFHQTLLWSWVKLNFQNTWVIQKVMNKVRYSLYFCYHNRLSYTKWKINISVIHSLSWIYSPFLVMDLIGIWVRCNMSLRCEILWLVSEPECHNHLDLIVVFMTDVWFNMSLLSTNSILRQFVDC